ncbi:MAG: hypothetical protein ACYC27_15435 [Armatimonadota bacterium]
MKKRTRIIAWIYMICTGYTFLINIIMYASIITGYSKAPWYLAVQILMWGFQWPFWIFLLRKQTWAWYVLTIIYAILSIEWIFSIGKWIIDGMPYSKTYTEASIPMIVILAGILFSLIIIVLPFWALLTDRPNLWKTNTDETSSLEEVTI